MPFITTESESGVRQRINIEDEPIIIGRHPECHVVIDEAAVSRRHAQIFKQNGKCLLEDLKSRNGTFLNQRMIHQSTRLLNGDQIRICDSVFTYQEDDLGTPVPARQTMDESINDLASSILLEEFSGNEVSSIMSQLDVSSHHRGTQIVASPEAKLEALMEITEALYKTISLDSVLPKVLECLFELFKQADRGFIVLTDEKGNLQPLAMKLRREQDEETIRISRTIVRHVLETKQAIISTDATSDERFDLSQSITDFRIRSMMCAPLFDSEGKAIGIIQLDTLRNSVGFETEDLDILATVAIQAGAAIDSAKMHQLALRQQALQHDLELANEIQLRLLPNEAPKLSQYQLYDYYRPAEQVGGDYFDYIRLDENRLAILVGDVVGHGIAAALLMAKLSAEARFALASHDLAAASMNQINRAISNLNLDRFITMVLALLDAQKNSISIVNAGHLPPILRRANGETSQLDVEKSGLPVGVVNDYEYQEFSIELAKGDMAVMYTDGINEAQNADGELFGNDRIVEFLKKHDSKQANTFGDLLVNEVRQHMEGENQLDDICLVCLSRGS